MQILSLRYTKWINFSQQRTGHFFQGRYKALLIDADSYLLELIRNVHLNPVRAGLVNLPDQYPWSGHHCYLGKELLPWLTTDWVLSQLGPTDQLARLAYREFVIAGIREERRKEFYAGTCEWRVLGDDRFIDAALTSSMEQQYRREGDVADVVATVCGLYQIGEEQLRASGKSRPYSKARALAAAIVHESRHLTLCELAKFLDRDISGLSKAAQRTLLKSKTDRRLAEELKTIKDQLTNVRMSNLTPKVALSRPNADDG